MNSNHNLELTNLSSRTTQCYLWIQNTADCSSEEKSPYSLNWRSYHRGWHNVTDEFKTQLIAHQEKVVPSPENLHLDWDLCKFTVPAPRLQMETVITVFARQQENFTLNDLDSSGEVVSLFTLKNIICHEDPSGLAAAPASSDTVIGTKPNYH